MNLSKKLKKHRERLDTMLREVASKPSPSIFRTIDYSYGDQVNMVTENGANIQYIKEPDGQIQLLAVTNNPYALIHIKNPSEKALAKAVELQPVLEYHWKARNEDL